MASAHEGKKIPPIFSPANHHQQVSFPPSYNSSQTLQSAMESLIILLTLVCEPESLAILWVVAVEVDDCLMSRAQERSREFTAAVLADQCAAVLRSITHLEKVVVIFSCEVQELDVCSCRMWNQAD